MIDLFAEIERVTAIWKLTHTTNAAGQEAKAGAVQETSEAPVPATTFAQIELGEEFKDRDGNRWEKRTERRAIAWFWEGGWQLDCIEFPPDEPVQKA